MVNKVVGVEPLSVTVVNEREAIVDLREEDPILEVSHLIPGLTSWEGQSVNVGCMMSSKRSLISIIQVGEEMQNKWKDLEREQKLIRDEMKECW